MIRNYGSGYAKNGFFSARLDDGCPMEISITVTIAVL
jgi:hypothetical protein